MFMPGMLYVKNVLCAAVVVVAGGASVVAGVAAIAAASAAAIAAAIAAVSVADEDTTVVAGDVGSVRLRIRSSIFGLANCLEL